QDRRGRIGHDLWLIDTSVIRASRAAAGAKKKSEGASQPRREKGDATPRTTRTCAGALAGRLRDEGASGLGQSRHLPGRVSHGWAGPRKHRGGTCAAAGGPAAT